MMRFRIAVRQQRVLSFVRDERGSVLPLVGLCMLMTFVIGAIVIDLGYQEALRSQMAAAADAAALAAVIELPSKSRAAEAALRYAEKNMPEAAHGRVLFKDDIEFGHWDRTHRSFDSGGKPVNAVRVTLRRSAENGNAAPTFFLHLFGTQEAQIATQSLAGIVVPLIEYMGDPSMLSEAEQKKIAEMIEEVERTNKEQMWDSVTKRYDRSKKMTPDEIEKFLVDNYGQPALLH
ncbi:MAG: TadG family pilus assembly protein [Dongiaceae bacterium]